MIAEAPLQQQSAGQGQHEHGNRGVDPMGVSSTVPPARRVRHEVRDSMAVMAFSAASSIVVALLLMLLVRFGN